MRTEKSLYNASSNFLILILKTILTFIVRTVFVKYLGEEYLGIDGLFTNILVMISLADLGLSIAVSFSLYKPLAENDYDYINRLMCFYKKVYSIIGVIVLFLGLSLIPFLKYFIEDVTVSNITLIYLLYLFNNVSMYFISYKETLIVADQQNYKLTIINFSTYLIMYILQIIILVYTRNFILYLIIQTILMLIQRVLVNRYVTKMYSCINFKTKHKLTKKEIKPIKENVIAVIYYKIGNFILSGTDNLVISYFLGVISVGLYTNYLSLTSMISSLIGTISTSITSSFGNLVVLEEEKTQKNVFEKINFFCFAIYGYCVIGILFLINPFIEWWIGAKYLLSFETVVLIVVVFYINGMLLPITTLRDAAGAYKYDKFSTIVQSIINIFLSILLVQFIGLNGVILGTLISTLLVPLWYRPNIIYKHVFNSSVKSYYLDYIKNILYILFVFLITKLVFSYINISSNIVNIFICGIVLTIVYSLVFYLVYRKNSNFIYYKNLIINLLKNFKEVIEMNFLKKMYRILKG